MFPPTALTKRRTDDEKYLHVGPRALGLLRAEKAVGWGRGAGRAQMAEATGLVVQGGSVLERRRDTNTTTCNARLNGMFWSLKNFNLRSSLVV